MGSSAEGLAGAGGGVAADLGAPIPSPSSPTRLRGQTSHGGGMDGTTAVYSPKGAMAAAKQRLQDIPAVVLPSIPAVRLGMTDETGRVTRLPIFGAKELNTNDVTYCSDAVSKSQEVLHAPRDLPVQRHSTQSLHDWKQLAVKMPYSATHDMQSYSCQSLDQDVVDYFVSHEGNYITEAPGEHLAMDIHINDKPSSRRQAQLLTSWFAEYLNSMASSGQQLQTGLRPGEKLAPLQTGGKNVAGRPLSDASPPLATPPPAPSMFSMPEFRPPVMEGLDPALDHALHEHMVKREKTLQGLQFLQATGLLGPAREHSNWCSLIQAIGVCYAFLAQQVGVHCFERGALMTQIWNLYSELVDMKFADMRQAVLIAENLRTQNEELKKSTMEAQRELSEYKKSQEAMTAKLKAQVVELTSRISGAQMERDEMAIENAGLEAEIEQLEEAMQPLHEEIREKEVEINDLQYNRDILLSTLSGMTSGHRSMQGMLPTLDVAAGETMATIQTIVRTRSSTGFNIEHVDTQNMLVQGEMSATKVKVVAGKLGSELKRVLDMGAMVDKKLEEDEEAAAAEAARRIEAEAKRLTNKPPPVHRPIRRSILGGEKVTSETQTPDEWAGPMKVVVAQPAAPKGVKFEPEVTGGEEEKEEEEPMPPSRVEAPCCPKCDRVLDMCSSCFKPPEPNTVMVKDKSAAREQEKVLKAAREAQEEMEEAMADLKETVAELKQGNASLRQEIGRLQDQLLKSSKKTTDTASTQVDPVSLAAALKKELAMAPPEPEPMPSGVNPEDDKLLKQLYREVERLKEELAEARAKMNLRAAEVKFNLPPSAEVLAESPWPEKAPPKPKLKSAKSTRSKSSRKIAPSSRNLQVEVGSEPSTPVASTTPKSARASGSRPSPFAKSKSERAAPVSPFDSQRSSRLSEKPSPANEKQATSFRGRSKRTLFTPQTPVPTGEVRGAYKNANLLEALDKYRNVKPRTPEWLLNFIDKVYKGKHVQDMVRSRDGQELLNLIDYMFQHLQGTYGTRMLVLEYVSQILVTLNTYMKKDTRFQVFDAFLTEEWDTSTLEVFLHSRAMLATHASVRCLEFPSDYVEKRGASPWLCTRKAIAVADTLLLQRSKHTVDSFKELLQARGQDVDDSEKERFFSSSDAGNMEAQLEEELRIRGPLLKVPTIVFQQMLCTEFHRCEQVLVEAAATLFKKYDYNSNGMQEYKELCDVVKQMQSEMGEEYDEEDARAMWKKAAAVQLQTEISKGAAVQQLSDITTIGMSAFREAVMSVPIVRRYVRLFMTPPLRHSTEDGETISLQKIIGMMVTRQWRLFGDDIQKLAENSSANVLMLNSLIGTVKREKDGPTRCGLYCRILKVMAEAKLEDLQAQCSPEKLMKGYDSALERNLTSMANAIKVFYGQDCLMLGNFPEDRSQGKIDVRSSVERLQLFNAIRFQAQTFAANMIQHGFRARKGHGNKLSAFIHMASTDVASLVKGQSMARFEVSGAYEVLDLDQERRASVSKGPSVPLGAIAGAAEPAPAAPVSEGEAREAARNEEAKGGGEGILVGG
eukprot:jgi/Tetstr1/431676/TSEL_021204.t1